MMIRTRVALAAAGSVAALSLLTACTGGGGSSENSFDPKVTEEVAAATAAVDSVTWNLSAGEPTSLDPAQSALESNSLVIANMCESLFSLTPSGDQEPALATSVEQVDDVTSVIELRDDVTFWDGNPMTADDVAFSINRILDPATASPWAMWALAGASATVTGDNQVTVTANAPYALTSAFFALPAFAVVEKAFAEAAGTAFGTAEGGVMCTGPYQLDNWAIGQDITLTKNANWWNGDRATWVDTATFTFTADPSAQIAALRSGSIDGMFRVPVSGFQSLAQQGSLLFNRSFETEFLAVSDLEGSLSDVKTRQALQALINYDGITDKIFLGTAESLRAVVPPRAWGYAEDTYQAAWDALPEATQDVEKAKKLVEESSYDGSEIVLAYPTIEEQTKVATLIADAGKTAGLNITLKPLPLADYLGLFGSPEAREGIDAFISIGYLDFADPAAYYQYFTTGNFYNFGNWSNPEYDALMTSALAEFDDDARADLVTQAQAILAEDAGAIPMVSPYLSAYYSDDLAGLVPSPSNLYSPWLPYLGGK